MSGGCLDESLVVAFLGGTLAAAARDQTEAHIAICSACADLVTWAAADNASGASRAPGSGGRPFIGALTPGSRVGRYQILGAVGRGGMGEVYAAYHPDLDRRIALKVVNESGAGSDERRARLLREARAIARLSHPNVVAVHDAGTVGDRVFIAMEFVDGQTVADWLHAAPRSWRQVLDVFVAAGRGLAAAHAAGVIHRDFKPQNVMIGHDDEVRVTDFGLALMVHEGRAVAPEIAMGSPPAPAETMTKTGALLGTPAYMSPEQSRGGAIDARSDQYSFCVALHEALLGTRPNEESIDARRASVPSWLRSTVLRGAAIDRDERYESMKQLLATIERGRIRLGRRAWVLGAALAAILLATSSWRLAREETFACSIPKERVASAWADNADHPRRQAIHAAFLASGRHSAEQSWRLLTVTLDEYIRAWSAMYLESCAATHVRREQSGDVLDLRTSCLNDNLDQVRALTDRLVTADGQVVSNAVSASKNLTPVARCADIPLLRSAVPLPRDERTLREVQRLRRALADVEAMREVGKMQDALAKALALRTDVDATGYKPLLGELLGTIGLVQMFVSSNQAEETLTQAVFTAEAAHDDVTAARAAIQMPFVVGATLGRHREAELWEGLANAILDRLGPGHVRLRAWAAQNQAANAWAAGDFKRTLPLAEQALALKQAALGIDHPDVAISLYSLGTTLSDLGRPADGLKLLSRAISILTNGDPANPILAQAYGNLGDALRATRREADAEAAYLQAIKINEGAGFYIADAWAGLGELRLSQRKPAEAIPLFEQALKLREQDNVHERMTADARFSLARALWDGGGNKRRAVALATAARETYARYPLLQKEPLVAAWLAAHRR